MQLGRMVPVASAPNTFAAHVLAARLGSEGIVCELRGASGQYPLGEVVVLVEADAIDTAREILLVEEVEATLEAAAGDEADVALRAPASLWLVVGVMVLVALVSFARVV